MTPNAETAQRKNVTRACDNCKKRKVRCNGKNPCLRCTKAHKECTYRASYSRGNNTSGPYNRPSTCRCHGRGSTGPVESNADEDEGTAEEIGSKLLNVEDTRREDASVPSDEDCIGDASVDAFLRRVSLHLAQIGQGLPRSLFKRHEEDSRMLDHAIQTVVLPEKNVAKGCLDAYFDHGNATCRFLPRDSTYAILSKLYANDPKLARNDAKMAIILLVIGTGCVWSASWKNESLAPWRAKAMPFLNAAAERLRKTDRIYPPSIEVLQAQMLKCQCELVIGHFNSAWMSLGWAVRLGQMIDIQREHTSGAEPLQAFYKRRLFWAMFMIDRYLAVILGRPMAIQESDVKVTLSPRLDDSLKPKIDAYERKLLQGTTSHYELVRIIGRATAQLYSIANSVPENSSLGFPREDQTQAVTDDIVTGLEAELQSWLARTPRFFHPKSHDLPSEEDQYYDIPWILKRQQRTVHSAYFFANMLIYRGYLLRTFYSQQPSEPLSTPFPPRAKLCTDYALSMIALVSEFGVDEGRYNGTFWITSHFLFSAISILLVYLTMCQDPDRGAEVERAVEDAMSFHGKLDNSVNISAQKLLEESRSRARIVQSIQTPTSTDVVPASAACNDPLVAQPNIQQSQANDDMVLMPEDQDWRAPWHDTADNGQVLESQADLDQAYMLGLRPLGPGQGFDMIMDIGFDKGWSLGGEDAFH